MTSNTSNTGWICLSRSILNHWIYQQKPFSAGQAWIDLLLHAAHKDKILAFKGQKIKILRGQQARSEVTLGDTWGWSRNRVRRFLKTLKTEQQIEQQTTQLTSIITICNYDRFQGNIEYGDTAENTESRTVDDTAPDTAGDTAGDTQITIKQLNNKTNNKRRGGASHAPPLDQGTLPPPDHVCVLFDQFWEAYPRQSDKPAALIAFQSLSVEDQNQAVIGAQNYRAQTEHPSFQRQYIKYPKTFLMGKSFWQPAAEQLQDVPVQQPNPEERAILDDLTDIDEKIRNMKLMKLNHLIEPLQADFETKKQQLKKLRGQA